VTKMETAFGGVILMSLSLIQPKQNNSPELAYACPEPFVSASP